MGKNNRQRRADKKRHSGRGPSGALQSGPDGGGPGGPAGFGPTMLAEMLLIRQAEACRRGQPAERDSTVAGLLRLGSPPGGGSVAASALSGLLMGTIGDSWEGGWQPTDLVRAVTKRHGARHAALAVVAIAAETSRAAVVAPEGWAAQLDTLGAGVWWSGDRFSFVEHWAERDGLGPADALGVGVELLGLIMNLPQLPCLVPPPSAWGRGGSATRRAPTGGDGSPQASRATAGQPGLDERVLAKLRALLAKAESTTFDDEADAFTAKAQELMARYAIDSALLDADRGAAGRADEVPSGRRIWIDDPYSLAKANLLGAVAEANRCRTIWLDSYGFSTVFGFKVDVDVVEVLFTSLLVQATRAMTTAGAVRDRSGRSRTRSFRNSFLIAFAQRIEQRLRGATAAAAQAAGADRPGALLPVLAHRRGVVDEAFAELFPRLVAKGVSVSNMAGWVAGQAAAEFATLGSGQQLLPGMTG